MLEDKQLTMIKGTRNGLTLFIDDECSFNEALVELQEKMKTTKPNVDEPVVSVTVHLGNRYLQERQKEKIKEIVGIENRFTIESFESNVIRKEDALQYLENTEVKLINRVVRSGQVLNINGDLLLIGDVNPGGKVVSTGNIYILGNLLGIAHAGVDGDREAVIIASYMKPTQLRITDYISRAPDYDSLGVYMECGFIDEEQDKIMIDRLQTLSRAGKRLDGFERRMKNG